MQNTHTHGYTRASKFILWLVIVTLLLRVPVLGAETKTMYLGWWAQKGDAGDFKLYKNGEPDLPTNYGRPGQAFTIKNISKGRHPKSDERVASNVGASLKGRTMRFQISKKVTDANGSVTWASISGPTTRTTGAGYEASLEWSIPTDANPGTTYKVERWLGERGTDYYWWDYLYCTGVEFEVTSPKPTVRNGQAIAEGIFVQLGGLNGAGESLGGVSATAEVKIKVVPTSLAKADRDLIASTWRVGWMQNITSIGRTRHYENNSYATSLAHGVPRVDWSPDDAPWYDTPETFVQDGQSLNLKKFSDSPVYTSTTEDIGPTFAFIRVGASSNLKKVIMKDQYRLWITAMDMEDTSAKKYRYLKYCNWSTDYVVDVGSNILDPITNTDITVSAGIFHDGQGPQPPSLIFPTANDDFKTTPIAP